MLAQNFKTADELGLTNDEHGALVRVLGMLEREEIPAGLFDMHHVGKPECGTPGCIFGWAMTVGFTRGLINPVTDGRLALDRLFTPTSWECDPYKATRSQAAVALRNYLTVGEPRWDEAMS